MNDKQDQPLLVLLETQAVRKNRALLESCREIRSLLLQRGEDGTEIGSQIVSSLRLYIKDLLMRLPENARLTIIDLSTNPTAGVRASVDIELGFGAERCVTRVEVLSNRSFRHDEIGEHLGDAFKDRVEAEILNRLSVAK